MELPILILFLLLVVQCLLIDKEIYKEVADTEAQQKLYKNLIKKDFEHEKDIAQRDIERLSSSANK